MAFVRTGRYSSILKRCLQFINRFFLNNFEIGTVGNNRRRLKEHKSVLPRKAGNGFSATQNTWQMEALNSHNSFRTRHGVSLLVLDDAISRQAQTYAEYLAKNNRFKHSSDRHDLGENLYTIAGSRSLMNNSLGKIRSLFSFNISVFVVGGIDATKAWYNEIKDYSFNNPGFSMATGHFTQLIWKNTNKMGIGFGIANEGKKIVVVARYGPCGNVIGHFPKKCFTSSIDFVFK